MKNQGITLVALVVTVIILLIIAGVAVSMITGNDGLFTKANEAGTLYNEEARKEAEWLQQLMDSEYLGGSGSSAGNPGSQNPPVNNGPLSNGSFDSVKKLNTPDVSKLPVATTKYVTWQDIGNGIYTEQASLYKPDNWYDYSNGKWANIKTTANGLEAYWVWIPRFAYKLPESGTTPKEIEVIFVKNDSKTGILADGTEVQCYYSTEAAITTDGSGLYVKKTSDVKDKWIIHPGFTFGDTQLNGIWFAKFEASNNSGKVEVIPGVVSWRDTTLSNSFNVTKAMQDTGGVIGTSTGTTTIDAHVSRNMEWGAVSVLSQSKYGVYNPKSAIGLTENGGDGTLRVWNNPNSSYITGSVGTTPDDAKIAYINCSKYNRGNGPKGSTTGTVYGVHDMAGGAWEQVMAVMETTTGSNIPSNGNTGFTTWPDSKYYDIYLYATKSIDYTKGKIGDMTSELSPGTTGQTVYSWNGDCANAPHDSYPVNYRGGSCDYDIKSGVMAYVDGSGVSGSGTTFRPVLVMP